MNNQRQCSCDNLRLTKSRNARSRQILLMPKEPLTNHEWLPGELLSVLECSKIQLVFRCEISGLFWGAVDVQAGCRQASKAQLNQAYSSICILEHLQTSVVSISDVLDHNLPSYDQQAQVADYLCCELIE